MQLFASTHFCAQVAVLQLCCNKGGSIHWNCFFSSSLMSFSSHPNPEKSPCTSVERVICHSEPYTGTWFGEHGGAGSTAGRDDLSGFFQTMSQCLPISLQPTLDQFICLSVVNSPSPSGSGILQHVRGDWFQMA